MDNGKLKQSECAWGSVEVTKRAVLECKEQSSEQQALGGSFCKPVCSPGAWDLWKE